MSRDYNIVYEPSFLKKKKSSEDTKKTKQGPELITMTHVVMLPWAAASGRRRSQHPQWQEL